MAAHVTKMENKAVASAKELKSEAASLYSDARAILDNPRATEADGSRAESIRLKADGIAARAASLERIESLQSDISESRSQAADIQNVSSGHLHSSFREEIRLIRAVSLSRGSERTGFAPMSNEHRAEWDRRMLPQNAGSTAPAVGGYSIAPEFQRELLIAMKSQSSMRGSCYTFTTDTGAALPWPTQDDRAQSGRLLTSENTTLATATDVPFGSTTMGAFTFVSDVALVSYQLIQDSAFDFGELLLNALSSRLARAEGPYFTTGTGTGQPQGIVVGAAAGVTGATGQTVTITFDNVVDLIKSVDPVYRTKGSFMMNDSTLQALRKLKDSTSRYLWQPYDNGTALQMMSGTLWGYPVVINNDMPVMAANAKSIAFGDLSSYKIRTVVDLRLTTLRERFIDSGQLGFIASIRSDGRLISGASPIKCYQNSAT